MVVRRTLTRLLRLRELEEEQSRLKLEAAVTNRNRAQKEFEAAVGRQAQGRRDFVTGILRQSQLERAGGGMEMERASRERLRLQPALETADAEVMRQQAELLVRRTGRRQVETLVKNERTKVEVEAGRRAQQMLDDWYGRRISKDGPRALPAPVIALAVDVDKSEP
jgi:hypothetical protein